MFNKNNLEKEFSIFKKGLRFEFYRAENKNYTKDGKVFVQTRNTIKEMGRSIAKDKSTLKEVKSSISLFNCLRETKHVIKYNLNLYDKQKLFIKCFDRSNKNVYNDYMFVSLNDRNKRREILDQIITIHNRLNRDIREKRANNKLKTFQRSFTNLTDSRFFWAISLEKRRLITRIADKLVGVSTDDIVFNSFYSDERALSNIQEQGFYLKLNDAIKTSTLFKNKSPQDKTEHVAVEIECGLKNISDLELAKHLMPWSKYVQIKYDGSLRFENSSIRSVELAICMPVSLRRQIVKEVCAKLTELGAVVNKTCGLHVHFDMRNKNYLDRELIFNKLRSIQPLMYNMNPISRAEGRYCKPNAKSLNANVRDRYRAINVAAYHKYSTYEIRVHSGTTDAKKINNWIDILEHVMSSNIQVIPKRAIGSLAVFNRVYRGLPIELLTYIQERINKFKVKNDNEITLINEVA